MVSELVDDTSTSAVLDLRTAKIAIDHCINTSETLFSFHNFDAGHSSWDKFSGLDHLDDPANLWNLQSTQTIREIVSFSIYVLCIHSKVVFQ